MATRHSRISRLAEDTVSVIKPSGIVIEGIQASVQGSKILIFDTTLPLEENDKIYRSLPSGLVEVFIVLDRGFIADPHGGLLSHYEAKVQREGSIATERYKSIVLNLADNSRVNINSTDKSVNTINNSTGLFEDIRRSLQEITDEAVKTQAIETLKALEAAKNKPPFTSLYMKFMGILADHLTIAPAVIQALTQFFPS